MTQTSSPRPFIPVRIAVLTVSDTRTLATDKSGDTLAERITEAGHTLSDRQIVKDDVRAIRALVRKWLKRADLDVVISTGGTGLTGRDVTVEAMRTLFEKEIEGFGVAFHMISFQKIGVSTVQSRATAGVAQGQIYLLPAGLARRLPRRLGRHPQEPARLPAHALQLRRDHAEARRASAAAQGLMAPRLTS